MNKRLKFIASALLLGVLVLCSGCMEKEKSYETALQKINDHRYEEALNYLNLSVSQGNKDKVLYAHKAIVLLKLERTNEAEASMQLALSGEKTAEIIKLEGIYRYETGDPERARECFLKVKQMEEDAGEEYDPEVLGYIARLLMEEGEYEQAVVYLNRLILSSYHLAEHELLAGLCYLKQNQFKAAGQYFEMLDEAAARKPSHYLYMYEECMNAGAYSLAETCFEKGKKLCGTKGEEMTEGEYYARAGFLAQAEETLVKENTAGSLLTQAWILSNQGNYEEAEALYDALIAGKEGVEEAYLAYMTEKIMKGDAAGARLLLQKIKTFDDEKILKRAAWNEVILYEQEGNYEAAYQALSVYKATYGQEETATRELLFLERILK